MKMARLKVWRGLGLLLIVSISMQASSASPGGHPFPENPTQGVSKRAPGNPVKPPISPPVARIPVRKH